MHSSSTRAHIVGTDAPMVARAAELEHVLSVLDDTVRVGPGRLLMLVGEPGVGKSRLARESLARARAVGVRGFTGRCFEQHAEVPFFPFAEPFAAALAEAPPEFQTELSSRWPELAYIVPALGPRPKGESDATQVQVFRAAAALFQALAGLNPFVLILEDLHWADTTSLGLLLYLGRHLHDTRTLILGTYRDVEVGRGHPLETTLRELIRERLVEEMHLSRLPLAGTAALVQSQLAGEIVSDQLVNLVHQRAQGNPFFTEELLAAFIEQGALSSTDAGRQAVALAQLRVPHSIHLVVGERVGRLPAESRDLLSLASVLGQEFDIDVLIAASDRSRSEVFAGLDAALEARLLADCPGRYGKRFAFVHALIQETLYEELPAHRRRALHQRLGEVLEAVPAVQGAATPELARHFLHAGDTERAVTYAIQAGDAARGRYAHAEAAHHYTIAVEVLRELGETARVAEILCRLGAELFDLNHLPDAITAYEAALACFEALGDHAGQASVHWGLGRLHLGRYDLIAAVMHLDTALRLWPSERDDADLARLMVDTARAKTFSADWDAAIQLADSVVRLAEDLGDPGLIARGLVGFAEAHSADKPDRILIQLMDRAEGLARQASDWRTLTRVFVDRAVNNVNIGELENAVADNRRAVETADRSGETERLRFALQAFGFHCVGLGAWEEGRTAARAGLALDPQGGLQGVAGRAVLAWMEGHYEDALAHFRAFGSDGRDRRDVQAVAYGSALLADCMLQLGRPSEAEGPAREAAEVTRTSWRSMAGFVAPLAETLVCLQTPDAEAVLADAERLIEATEKFVARPQLLRARGLLEVHRGDLTDALATLAASAAVARSQHAVIELARTLVLLADAARTCGDLSLAAQADAERAEIVVRIGPEVRGLAWARDLPSAPMRFAKRVRSTPGEPSTPLSRRELEVAALLLEGLTDRQIAERLVVTEGTAGVHVSHILNKLGFHSRAEIASWARRQGLSPKSDPRQGPRGLGGIQA